LQTDCAFIGDVVESVCANVPASRVGVRISPYAAYNNTRDPDPDGTTAAVSGILDEAGVAYLHLADTNAWLASRICRDSLRR